MVNVIEGMRALKRGQLEVAENIFAHRLRVNPKEVESLRGLALICMARYDSSLALELLSIALQHRPNFLEARCDMARIFISKAQHREALKILDVVTLGETDISEIQLLRGNALRALGQLEDALLCYESGHAPQHHEEFSINRANVLIDMKRFKEAETVISSIVSDNPRNEHARLNQSLLWLRLGRWSSGWPLQEARLKKTKDKGWQVGGLESALQNLRKNGSQPSVLVYSEQGLGDLIQYLRFLSSKCLKNSELTVQVPAALEKLVAVNFPGANVNTDSTVLNQDFDIKISILSLPAALGFQGEQDLHSEPYIRAPMDRAVEIRDSVRGRSTGRCIGLQWRGGDNPRLINRSMPIELLGSISGKGDRLVSLRQEPSAAEAKWLDDFAVARLDELMTSFLDTAAVIENLDIVVTVDTSIAHLAGAMGKRTIILLPFAAAWIWMEERADSPWYPSVTLIRQNAPGDWGSCLATLQSILQQ